MHDNVLIDIEKLRLQIGNDITEYENYTEFVEAICEAAGPCHIYATNGYRVVDTGRCSGAATDFENENPDFPDTQGDDSSKRAIFNHALNAMNAAGFHLSNLENISDLNMAYIKAAVYLINNIISMVHSNLVGLGGDFEKDLCLVCLKPLDNGRNTCGHSIAEVEGIINYDKISNEVIGGMADGSLAYTILHELLDRNPPASEVSCDDSHE